LSEIGTHTIDPSAASPGAILKRCREYHEISLEEAEEATKIGANYLQALEEDQIGQFASLAYLKGFLRIYTTYLGLNPDDMIRLFDKLYSSGSPQNVSKKNTAGKGEHPPRKKFPLQKLAMPAILLVLIILTAAIINRTPSASLTQSRPAPAAVPTSAPAVQPVFSSAKTPPPGKKAEEISVNQSRQDSLPATVKPPTPAATQESSKGFIVRMKVTQSGTLKVTIDGSTSQDYDLSVGDSIEWKAERNIALELSNSGGVDVELNGRQLKPLGLTGKSAVVVLDAEGLRQ
jgi:cytoskeletal protein RodZ